jgi:hypothetical protein
VRHVHILRKNEKTEIPSRALFVVLSVRLTRNRNKTTTYALEKGLVLAWYTPGRRFAGVVARHSFTTAKQFAAICDAFARERTRSYIVVEHDAQALALLDVFNGFLAAGYTCTLAVIDTPPTLASWRKEKQTLYLFGVSNIWPTLSSNISHAMNATPWPSGSREQPFVLDDDQMRERADRISTHLRSWWQFLAKEDLGNFRATAASQAMGTFRHKYMDHQILVDCNHDALRLARSAYSGGRTECFFIGRVKGDYYLLDINSMYAAVMRDMRVPVRLRGYTEHATVDYLRDRLRNHVVVARVRVRTSVPVFGVREGISLRFPTGTFDACLAESELQWALDHGALLEVRAMAHYQPAPAFRRFVVDSWQRRRDALSQGDGTTAEGYKLLMASFYGKWGQGGGVWEKVSDVDNNTVRQWSEVSYEDGVVTEWRQFGGILQRLCIEGESAASVPAIAATVTANARMLLWSYIAKAGVENVLYVDTDSLLVNRIGFDRLTPSIAVAQLGGLRLDGRFSDIHIRTCKSYRFDNRQRSAGTRRDAVLDSSGTLVQDQLRGFASLVRDGDISQLHATRVSKRFSHVYDKGVVGTDGRVTPFRRA